MGASEAFRRALIPLLSLVIDNGAPFVGSIQAQCLVSDVSLDSDQERD